MTEKMTNAIQLLNQAKDAMIEGITEFVNDPEEKCAYYTESEPYDAGEERVIKFNDNGDLAMFDDYDNELVLISDLSCDDLRNICINIRN